MAADGHGQDSLFPAPKKWIGWHRSGGPWERICEVETEREAWAILIAYHPVAAQQAEKTVLPEGKRP